jgi:lipopolysaccharide/colanic/teichoic acid biosynthesis glycosyltransferase
MAFEISDQLSRISFMSSVVQGVNIAEEARVPAKSIADWYSESIKRSLDCFIAAVMLLVSAPVILLALLLVRMTSRGSAIYAQTRLGRGGRTFRLYKIRTMYKDSERDTGPIWSPPGDLRVTPPGRLLRWTHMDELPQLVNILRGEMSLVGPRPERPEIVSQIERALPQYRLRMTVRPGLTGLAQIQQGPDTDLSSVRRKLNYDLWYVERISFKLDLRILIGTVLRCSGVSFDRIGRILRLPKGDLRPQGEPLPSPPEFSTASQVSPSYLS